MSPGGGRTSTPREQAEQWLSAFAERARSGDFAAVATMFAEESYWRDLLALTWDLRTFQGPGQIEAAMRQTYASSGATNFRLEDRPVTVGPIGHYGDVVEAFFTFGTAAGLGRGFVRLLPADTGNVRAFTFLTTLHELAGHPERVGVRRPRENLHAPERGVRNWLDRRTEALEFADQDPQVLIVGGGQSGLTVAARLGALGVSALLVDRMTRVGDNWRNRYHSLILHNESCVNHLPFMPFPETFPAFIPKDMLADWFESYAKALELNVWTGTDFLDGEYDETARTWSVRVRRPDGTIRILRPTHVVMAIGVAGIPSLPAFPGTSDFTGPLLHSSAVGNDLDVNGKKVVVVGSGNSAHDIAQDLYLRGADVVMVQRSSTTVVSLEPSSTRVFGLYSQGEGVRPTEDTDLMSSSVPIELMRRIHIPLSRQMARDDRVLLDGLARVGFATDLGEDGSGFYMKFMRFFGRYYINVGASDLIVDGKIKLKSGVGVRGLRSDSVDFDDGSRLPADIVVLATGFHPLQESVRSLFGDQVSERVGPIWGLGPDGELRGMWSRTGQDRFYVHGGGLAMCRIYSTYIALQIKADLEGLLPAERFLDQNAELQMGPG